jgi:hypothetical protein
VRAADLGDRMHELVGALRNESLNLYAGHALDLPDVS